MARNNFIASTRGVVATTVAAKTILTVTSPANIGVALKSICITFDSNNAGQQALLVELIRFDGTTAGTAGSTVTAGKKMTGTNTVQSVVKTNYSVEPTVAEILEQWHVNPAAGMQYPFPINEEPIARNGEVLAIRITSNTGITPNVVVDLECEE